MGCRLKKLWQDYKIVSTQQFNAFSPKLVKIIVQKVINFKEKIGFFLLLCNFW